MAAVTVAESHQNVIGKNRVVDMLLTAPADGDTLDVTTQGILNQIKSVQVTFSTASAAADSVSVTRSADKKTLTFNVIGTARSLWVQVLGI